MEDVCCFSGSPEVVGGVVVVVAASEGDMAPARRCENDFNSCSASWSLRKLEAMLMGLSALLRWWVVIDDDDDDDGASRFFFFGFSVLLAFHGQFHNPYTPDETHSVTTVGSHARIEGPQ